jgi:putative SOS response-associated peptidase YedK
MCNDYRLKVDAATIGDVFADLKITLRFPEGVPNIQPRDEIRITDTAPIVRAAAGEPGAAELVQRRWSWPAPNKKPVYNFRSEGREFANGRCLILVDGFYEFTAPADTGRKRKDKWLFTKVDEPLFCVAGIWRSVPDLGEAFTMLTMAPGADVAPYHDRQIAVLDRRDWSSWLNPTAPAREVLRPLPAGSFRVERVA